MIQDNGRLFDAAVQVDKAACVGTGASECLQVSSFEPSRLAHVSIRLGKIAVIPVFLMRYKHTLAMHSKQPIMCVSLCVSVCLCVLYCVVVGCWPNRWRRGPLAMGKDSPDPNSD